MIACVYFFPQNFLLNYEVIVGEETDSVYS